MGADHTVDDDLKQAELLKLRAETRRADAEAAKYEAEQKDAAKPYYKTGKFLQVVVTGLVGVPVLFGLFDFIIRPFYDKEVIKAEALLANKDLDLAKKRIEVDSIQADIKKMVKIISFKEANNILLTNKNKETLSMLARKQRQIDSAKAELLRKEEIIAEREKDLKIAQHSQNEAIKAQMIERENNRKKTSPP